MEGFVRLKVHKLVFLDIKKCQVLCIGRIYRANCKTHVRQRIIFCANTCEQQICEKLRAKIINIAMLNDADLGSLNIEGLDVKDNKDDSLTKIETSEFTNTFVREIKTDGKNDNISGTSNFENLFERFNMLNNEKELLYEKINTIDIELAEIKEKIEKTFQY